jgi:hypothetical protein
MSVGRRSLKMAGVCGAKNQRLSIFLIYVEVQGLGVATEQRRGSFRSARRAIEMANDRMDTRKFRMASTLDTAASF